MSVMTGLWAACGTGSKLSVTVLATLYSIVHAPFFCIDKKMGGWSEWLNVSF